MKKSEFERKIKELKLEKVYCEGKSVEETKEFYETSSGIYGCYKDGDKYIIFFKDSERGIIKELGAYKTEDEAYEKLFETINLWNQKNN